MARDGEILNKDILRAAAAFFGFGGVKQGPAQINLDDVKLTYDVGPRPSITNATAVADPGGGQGSWDSYTRSFDVGGTVGVQYQGLLQSAELGTNAFRVDSLVVELEFPDAAAVTAFIAQIIDFQVGLRFELGDPGFFPVWVGRFSPVSNILIYRLSLRGANSSGVQTLNSSWNGAVPAVVGQFGDGILRLTLDMRTMAGANWPASTVIRTFTTARQGTNGVVPVD